MNEKDVRDGNNYEFLIMNEKMCGMEIIMNF